MGGGVLHQLAKAPRRDQICVVRRAIRLAFLLRNRTPPQLRAPRCCGGGGSREVWTGRNYASRSADGRLAPLNVQHAVANQVVEKACR